MAKSESVKDLFQEFQGMQFFTGGKEAIEYDELTPDEQNAVDLVVEQGADFLSQISVNLGQSFKNQMKAFERFAGVAKATFPVEKTITYPSQPGTLGVNLLIPEAIKYAATPNPSAGINSYTSYANDSWDIPLTAGSVSYILGAGGTNYYTASNQTNMHEFIIIAENGLVEVGTTPKAEAFQIYTQIQSKYGIYTAQPLTDVSIEKDLSVYQYPTLGMIPVYPNLGVQWGLMPRKSGVSSLRLLGIFVYEHEFMPALANAYV